MSDFVELMEILSDNYFNNYTRSSKVFDIPRLLYTDADARNFSAMWVSSAKWPTTV